MNDPFAILGVPRSFRVTPAQVQAAHLRICATLHPDRARDAMERDDFMRRAAVAGQAKQQLMTELGRAEALVAALRPGGADRSAPGVADMPEPALPPAFLMQAMEIRERIEGAMDDAVARAELRAEVDAARAECVAELATALDALERGSDATSWTTARAALARLRYIERMLTRLREGAA